MAVEVNGADTPMCSLRILQFNKTTINLFKGGSIMLLKKLAVAFVVVGLLATAAFAQNRQVNVVNNTSMIIHRIYIMQPGQQNSIDIACSGCPLAPGRSQVVSIPLNVGARYSMNIASRDGDEYSVYFTEFHKADLTVTNGRPDITFTDSDMVEDYYDPDSPI